LLVKIEEASEVADDIFHTVTLRQKLTGAKPY